MRVMRGLETPSLPSNRIVEYDVVEGVKSDEKSIVHLAWDASLAVAEKRESMIIMRASALHLDVGARG